MEHVDNLILKMDSIHQVVKGLGNLKSIYEKSMYTIHKAVS